MHPLTNLPAGCDWHIIRVWHLSLWHQWRHFSDVRGGRGLEIFIITHNNSPHINLIDCSHRWHTGRPGDRRHQTQTSQSGQYLAGEINSQIFKLRHEWNSNDNTGFTISSGRHTRVETTYVIIWGLPQGKYVILSIYVSAIKLKEKLNISLCPLLPEWDVRVSMSEIGWVLQHDN